LFTSWAQVLVVLRQMVYRAELFEGLLKCAFALFRQRDIEGKCLVESIRFVAACLAQDS